MGISEVERKNIMELGTLIICGKMFSPIVPDALLYATAKSVQYERKQGNKLTQQKSGKE